MITVLLIKNVEHKFWHEEGRIESYAQFFHKVERQSFINRNDEPITRKELYTEAKKRLRVTSRV